MLGFTARSDGGTPVARDGELEEVAWFTRASVLAAARDLASADMALPPPVSIARFLIDRWLEGG
jgi:NAD+ diphosphatase